MDTGSGSSRSPWMEVEMPRFPPLERDTAADVCVVGAGIAGLTTAYSLAREGVAVVVLDQRHVGGGETLRTTAHLAPALDDRFHELERLHGREGARLAADSHAAAVRYVEDICRDEWIECEFRRVDGYLFEPPGGDGAELARELTAAWAAGLEVEHLDRAPLEFGTGPCLRFAGQAQFHPGLYLAGLAAATIRRGARLFDDTQVVHVDPARRQVGTQRGATVTAREIVVATNSPINDRVAMHTKQAPYRTYVIALRIEPEAVPVALYWDTAEPYHYVRVARGARGFYLVVGGEDHKTGQADDVGARYERLERWARERFPALGAADYRWSGQVMEPVDSLAFIGRNPGDRHAYVATGDSGNGMTHGTLAGMIIPDLIRGRANPWAALYDPERRRLGAFGEFARENLNVAARFREHLTAGELDSVDQVPGGHGAIVRDGRHKLAAYRDPDGGLHVRSAVCTHLGCIVHWNPAERSWDCPCHGSRFGVDGHVLAGPAHAPLAAVDLGMRTPGPAREAPGSDRRPDPR